MTVKTGDTVYRVVERIDGADKPTWEVQSRLVIRAGPKSLALDSYFGGSFVKIYDQADVGRVIHTTSKEAVDRFVERTALETEFLRRRVDYADRAWRWVANNLQLTKEIPTTACRVCDGSGFVEDDDPGRATRVQSRTCGYCRGTGRVRDVAIEPSNL